VSAPERVAGPSRLALLAEVLLVGVLVCVAALPVVTVLGAAGAGTLVLRELIEEDRTPRVRRFLSLLRVALREPVALLAPVLFLLVGAFDGLALLAGLPGAVLAGPVIGLVLLFGLVSGLRAMACWRPERGWRMALASGTERAGRDWRGSLLLAGAVLVCGVVADQAFGFVPVLPGLLALAALAVDRRSGPGRKRLSSGGPRR